MNKGFGKPPEKVITFFATVPNGIHVLWKTFSDIPNLKHPIINLLIRENQKV